MIDLRGKLDNAYRAAWEKWVENVETAFPLLVMDNDPHQSG